MQRILVAVDPRHDAEPVLARAAQLSARHGAAVIVHHVVEDMETAETEMRHALEQYARATLASLAATAGFTTTPSFKVELGIPHRCVNTAAQELSADIILIGPGQPSTVMQRVFGSTADRIVRTASVPVLVVRNRSARPYRNITVAMDFSPLSEAALAAARTLAPDIPIDLVHAYEVPLPFEQAMLRAGTSPTEAERFRQARMDDCRRRLADLARKYATGADTLVLRGAPGTTLVELSRSGGVDLIALGTQGRNAAAQALLGSVVRRLLAEAGCDLLVTGHIGG